MPDKGNLFFYANNPKAEIKGITLKNPNFRGCMLCCCFNLAEIDNFASFLMPDAELLSCLAASIFLRLLSVESYIPLEIDFFSCK